MMDEDRSYQLGIDVGGTFTDFLLLDDQGATSLGKTLSTDPLPRASSPASSGSRPITSSASRACWGE